jgi:drug/metabolite transporter (DMT)-like permease
MKKALIQMHTAVLLWGFTGVLGRAINLDAPVLVWYRMLITALFMLAVLSYRRQWMPIAPKDRKQITLIGCLIGLHWIAFYGAIKYANASIALVCLSTASVFTSLLDPLVNKGKRDAFEIVLGLIALCGVYLIYRFQEFYGIGILLGVIAAILSSVFTVLNKRITHKYPARTLVFYEMSTGWVLISLLLPLQFYYVPATVFVPHAPNLFGPDWYHNDWLWLAVISICCTVWAQSLSLTALKKLSSFTVTLSVNLEPVYGILLAFLIYKENSQLQPGFYWGMGLILLSVVLQTLRLITPRFAGFNIVKEKAGID